MTIFTQHSTLLIIMLLIIAIGTLILTLRAWRNWCSYMEQYDLIQERELLKTINQPKEDELQLYMVLENETTGEKRTGV